MQIDRLLNIVLILLKNEHTTAKKLSEHFNVSRRTIYRDIDTLSLAGVPIYCTKGNGGGIRLLENYRIDRSFLTEKERNEILFSLQSINAASFPNVDTTLAKLSELFQDTSTSTHDDWIEIDFSYWGSSTIEKEKFSHLKEGITTHRCLHIEYYTANGSLSDRLVEPLKLIFKNHSWYLIAYCQEKKDYRTFRISRIKSIQLTDYLFNRALPSEYHSNQTYDSKDTVKLHLKFSKDVAYRVYDDFSHGKIQHNDDGTFDVTIHYPYDEWLIGYLLSFGDKVRVISPEFVKDHLKNAAQSILKKYS